MELSIVILAAGQGTRMRSTLPKVLRPVAGRPLLEHIVQTCSRLSPDQIIVIHGYKGDIVKEAMQAYNIDWVEQKEQLGTGHAVKCALPVLKPGNQVLVLYGDVPLISEVTLKNFCEAVKSDDKIGLMTAFVDDPSGYGRILRDMHKGVAGIVEEKDATEEQRLIDEVNTGIYLISTFLLNKWLPVLQPHNAQNELYLTDLIKMAVDEKVVVVTVEPQYAFEVQGANDRAQLATLERHYQFLQAEQLMAQGVTLLDPLRLDVRGDVQVGTDVTIDVNVLLEGNVVIGDNCTIGANVILKDVQLADNVLVDAFSHLEAATVESDAIIGPYARLRPGSDIKAGAKIGNFVEVKKSVIGKKSKVNHLSYVGDAELGEGVNIGAGTITCNYDGVNKFKTKIGNRVFVGSNSQLVAPVEVGDDAFIAAGSTITKNAPAGKLTLSRAPQKIIEGWKKPKE